MYKPKSWPHAIISVLAMVFIYYFIPPLPVVIYAGLLPIAYYYGREVRDAEMSLGITSLKYLIPLMPWLWKDNDNKWDFYLPIICSVIAGICLTFWKVALK